VTTTIRFGLALLLLSPALAAAAEDKKEKEPPVSGKFTGNGKEAKLAYAVAGKGEPYLDKPTTVLVFTEKDPSKEKKPKIAAGFGRLGSALVITVDAEGKIIGCTVAHEAHKKSGFSTLGQLKMSDFKVADGKLKGKLATDGVADTFGEKWEVKLTFQVKAP
jgi:hypothetical protein